MEPRPGQDGQDETPSTADASWLARCITTTGTVSHVPLPALSLQTRTNSLLHLLLTKTYIYYFSPFPPLPDSWFILETAEIHPSIHRRPLRAGPHLAASHRISFASPSILQDVTRRKKQFLFLSGTHSRHSLAHHKAQHDTERHTTAAIDGSANSTFTSLACLIIVITSAPLSSPPLPL
ncbi:hypothetical protein NW759_014456 [Fusarium solani]|nr:hypothetical protein NW759_014456 [Fusarium solani]